jgi:hypothetical protein
VKIVLVQFYQYHEEVLAPQINFLLPDNELFVAAPGEVFKNDYISAFEPSIKKIVFSDKKYDKKSIHILFRILSIINKYIQLFFAVKKNNIEAIIFNTINKRFHICFIKILFGKTKNIHIIHNAQVFKTERAVNSLSLFKLNLFLSFDIYNYFINKHTGAVNNKKFDWFLPSLNNPVFYEDFPNDDILSGEKINIVIPGSVDDNRRNYNGLLNALDSIKDNNVPFQIIFLGKTPENKQRLINEKKLNHIVKTFADYVPGKLMLYLIKNSDAIAFLIDKTINCQIYNTYKATGTSIFCLSFGIPCIVSDDFILDTGLKDRAIVYPESHIDFVFNDMIKGKLTKEYFRTLKNIAPANEYSAEFQRAHYRKLIDSIKNQERAFNAAE